MESLLNKSGISVIDDFLNNWETIKLFYERYYPTPYPKTVLCGINPGRLGAGKTGIPFIDFVSLSKMLPNVKRTDAEKSAQFFYDVVAEIGADNFYKSFYVTNISWLGYIKNNKNLNYHDLPDVAKHFVLEAFKTEMKLIAPTTIISLSKEVKKTINELFYNTNISIEKQLTHPYNCSIGKSNYQNCKDKYVELLSEYIKA